MEELESDFEVFYPDRALFSSQRAKETQENWCQLLLSLHLNSGPLNAKGCELWYQGGSEKRKKLSFCLKDFLSEFPLLMRGVKSDEERSPAKDPTWKGGMGILREFGGPATVIELLFISNLEEGALLLSPKFLGHAAHCLARGVRGFVSQEFRFWDVKVSEVQGALSELYRIGIIKGYPDGSFRPEAPLTRGEAAILFSRFLQLRKLTEGRR